MRRFAARHLRLGVSGNGSGGNARARWLSRGLIGDFIADSLSGQQDASMGVRIRSAFMLLRTQRVARCIATVALAFAVGALALRVVQVLLSAIAVIDFPASLDYGEGIVLQQALLLTSPKAYGDITQYPFIVFNYPPGYLIVTRLVAEAGMDIVLAGRLVSLLSTIATACLSALFVRAALSHGIARGARNFGAAVAGLTWFAWTPVADWIVLARIDMLSLALTLGGLYGGLRATDTRWGTWLAALLFTLAVFTRQTTIAAPIATTVVLLAASPRDAARLVLRGLVISLSLLGVAAYLTDGGLFRHIVLYNLNTFDADNGWHLIAFAISHAVFAMLAVSAILEGVRLLKAQRGETGRQQPLIPRGDIGARAFATVALYVAISTPLLAAVFKSGASVNYFFEWALGCTMLIGMLLGWAAATVRGLGPPKSTLTPWSAAIVGVAALVQVVRLPAPSDRPASPAVRMAADELIEIVRRADRPVVSSDMIILLRAGQDVPWEPAIFRELSAMGGWDESLFLDMVRAGRFAFLLTYPGDRFSPGVTTAFNAAFPIERQLGWMRQHLPASAD
jgi:hypothetical protein